ncbi:class I SAM-dependent methyltransferase [Streptomyces sp. AK02-01A]|uniref:class I SAM-dependent methyltransferase n=1 Tax=Streptomyces sp. AK02-01A TaxID=3028648 RepID=UPI0029AAD680|nr:methyltransferase domain-containing protein [Streptomyces sp. AK02-01A]MDX3849618.1 methyltransferase domain-containing protein [Streptomyces sp. AK02-01A]MDX3849812.1 methyltransferase domain-containing protein [Streptomyces sp. AK02-01A]
MTPQRVAPEVVAFYSTAIEEADRLTGSADGVLEMIRTRELLRRFLPAAPARVLDVGGGPGTHARWLVEDGYTVHLVDPVEKHIEQARTAGCTVELGDAGALSAEDDSYDVVLVLGPLYHLLSRKERDQALAEAYRVVRPGGLVAAAAINRYSSLFEQTAFARLHTERLQSAVGRILATSVHDGRRGFTTAYFHRAEELASEMRETGFGDTTVYGIEGPAWGMLKAAEQHTGESVVGSSLFESALAAARMAEPYPELLAASSHLLAVGHRPESGLR